MTKEAPPLLATFFKTATVALGFAIVLLGAETTDQCGIRKYLVVMTLGPMLALLIGTLCWNLTCRIRGWRKSIIALDDDDQGLPKWLGSALFTVVVFTLLPPLVLAPCSFRFADP